MASAKYRPWGNIAINCCNALKNTNLSGFVIKIIFLQFHLTSRGLAYRWKIPIIVPWCVGMRFDAFERPDLLISCTSSPDFLQFATKWTNQTFGYCVWIIHIKVFYWLAATRYHLPQLQNYIFWLFGWHVGWFTIWRRWKVLGQETPNIPGCRELSLNITCCVVHQGFNITSCFVHHRVVSILYELPFI